MKKVFLLLAMPLLLVACKHKTKLNLTTNDTDVVSYPYPIKHPDNWDINPDHKNTLIVLNTLKAFENNDTTKAKKYFGDSVDVLYDGGAFNGKTSNMLKIVYDENRSLKNLKVKINDFQTIISKDNKAEWVTTWSTQYWDDAIAGKKDSIDYVDDVQLKGGKIVKWYEFSRSNHKKR